MALEASDMNDGAILQQTVQVENDKGWIQYKITLPMGGTLTSEFFPKDRAKEAMRAWLETVKQQAVAEAKEHRLKQRREKMELERKPGDDEPLFRAGGARQKEPIEIVDSPRPDEVSTDAKPVTWVSDAVPQNPLDYAKAQYKLHLDKVTELKPQLRAYEAGLAKWELILHTFEDSSEEK